MSKMAPAVLVARNERYIVQAFRKGKAVSGPSAQRLRTLGLKDTVALQELITATIVRKAGPDRFFLHEPTWVARDHMSWHTVRLLGAGLGIIALAVLAYFILR
jgi:hypothetical protein